MKLKDVKVGQRFGFEKTAAYFGRDVAMVWTRIRWTAGPRKRLARGKRMFLLKIET